MIPLKIGLIVFFSAIAGRGLSDAICYFFRWRSKHLVEDKHMALFTLSVGILGTAALCSVIG